MVTKLGIDKLRGELSCACLRTYIDKRAYVLFVPNTNTFFFNLFLFLFYIFFIHLCQTWFVLKNLLSF